MSHAPCSCTPPLKASKCAPDIRFCHRCGGAALPPTTKKVAIGRSRISTLNRVPEWGVEVSYDAGTRAWGVSAPNDDSAMTLPTRHGNASSALSDIIGRLYGKLPQEHERNAAIADGLLAMRCAFLDAVPVPGGYGRVDGLPVTYREEEVK